MSPLDLLEALEAPLDPSDDKAVASRKHSDVEAVEEAIDALKSQAREFLSLVDFLFMEFELPKEVSLLLVSMIPFRTSRNGSKTMREAWVDDSKLFSRLCKPDRQYFQTWFKRDGLFDDDRFSSSSTYYSGLEKPIKEEEFNAIAEKFDAERMHDYYFSSLFYMRKSGDFLRVGKHSFPQPPCDMLGTLSKRFGNMWFYLKTAHPNWERLQVDGYKVALVAKTLPGLLRKMDVRDVKLCVDDKQKYKPLSLDRCGCFMCKDEWSRVDEAEKSSDSSQRQT